MPHPTEFHQKLKAEQLRLHKAAVPQSVLVGTLAGFALLAVLWDHTTNRAILAWVGWLPVGLVARLGVAWAHGRNQPDGWPPDRWLWAYRGSLAIHGLIWALLSVILWPYVDPTLYTVLGLALFAVAIVSLMVISYDSLAALLFAAPALSPLLGVLLFGSTENSTELRIAVGCLLAMALFQVWRAYRSFCDGTRQTLLEADRKRTLHESTVQIADAQRALMAKSSVLSALMDASQQGFWFLDAQGMTVDINPAMCKQLGCTAEYVMCRHIDDFFEDKDLHLIQRELAARRQGLSGRFEIGLCRADGERAYFLVDATVMRSADGVVTGSVGVWTDITERRRDHMSLRIYELTVNSITDMVSVIDESLRYRMVNHAWRTQMNCERAEVVGQETREFFKDGTTADRKLALHACIDTQTPQKVTGTIEIAAFADKVMETAYYPYTDTVDGARCAVLITRDITARIRNEEKLESLSVELTRKSDALDVALENIAQGFISYEPDGRISVYNQRALAMLDLPASLMTPDASYQKIQQFQLERGDLAKLQEIHDSSGLRRFYAEGADNSPQSYVRQTRTGEMVEIKTQTLPNGGWVRTYTDVTRYLNALAALQVSEAEQGALLDSFPGYISAFDQAFVYTYVNKAFADYLGKKPEELVGKHVADIVGNSTFLTTTQEITLARSSGASRREIRITKTPDGRVLDLDCTHVCGPYKTDGTQTYFSFAIDITARKAYEEELRIAATAFEAQEGLVVTDATGAILRINKAYTEITGYTPKDVLGKNPRVLQSGRQGRDFYRSMWDSITTAGGWYGELWGRRKNGEHFPEWLSITAVKNAEGEVTHYVGTLRDITERKNAEAKITELAFFDQLTGLPNRTLLVDRLKQGVASNLRHSQQGSVLMIDLDNFKILNDSLGHDVGDLLLKQVSSRLLDCVRDGDTVARLGGDEFVVILVGLDSDMASAASAIESVAHKIGEAISAPYLLNNMTHHCSASIGATLFSAHDASIDELLKQADLAMYTSKDNGRNTFRFFDHSMQSVVVERAALETDLRRGIAASEFVLFYQPQVNRAGRVAGCEALVRWQHPEKGLLAPSGFIPMAEESGLILPLGSWVLEQACRQLAQWALQPSCEHLVLAVNVSARQVQQNRFVADVVAMLERTGANPKLLKLELTESLLVSNLEDVIAKMSALKAMGVGLSLDDFGTGFSSLSYLSRLPIDQIKIDRSFVSAIETREDAVAICAATISLAHALRLQVVAEGVETESQRYFLSTVHRCDYIQGYLNSRPIPLNEFEAYMAAN
ncbi:MAG: EAL domain-containing protein [Burkholderiaceae bacterium]|nr:EAL domain-containing protein [Burkholderiaceae bacterium]